MLQVGSKRVPTILRNSGDYWGLGLCPLFRIAETRQQTFRKLDLFPSSGEEETPTVLGPLEGANLNHSVAQ
jgi:hypothetical protein